MACSSCPTSGIFMVGVGVGDNGVGVGDSGVGVSVYVAIGCVGEGGIDVVVTDGLGPQPFMAQVKEITQRSSEIDLFISDRATWKYFLDT